MQPVDNESKPPLSKQRGNIEHEYPQSFHLNKQKKKQSSHQDIDELNDDYGYSRSANVVRDRGLSEKIPAESDSLDMALVAANQKTSKVAEPPMSQPTYGGSENNMGGPGVRSRSHNKIAKIEDSNPLEMKNMYGKYQNVLNSIEQIRRKFKNLQLRYESSHRIPGADLKACIERRVYQALDQDRKQRLTDILKEN
eukprot:TRINITY_DN8475_c0_g1_i1.p1 TRINITY_DN8475_c0_g1~~TRINITY_DN8475_c0_g1_i1.p1  ORF type:complete len:196 (+),score=17.66 TRINITY_DN8475_c0_g1_i1:284-871(+)